jgi:uncharacterized membrane protein
MNWTLEPIFDSTLAGGLLTAMVIAALWTITPRGLNRSRRRTVRALRTVAAIAVLLTMWRPAMVRQDNRPATASLAIAIDVSRSMTLASGDATAGQSRWDQQREVLNQLARGLSGLDDQLRVDLIAYEANAEAVGSSSAGQFDDLLDTTARWQPDGNVTDLAGPLAQSVQQSRERPLTGIILMGDGLQTATADDLQTPRDARQISRLIGAQGIPLWTVLLGPPSGVGAARDVAIDSLDDSLRLFSGNETDIRFELKLSGLVGTPVNVTLGWVREDDSGANGGLNQEMQSPRIVAQRTVTASDVSETVAMSLPVVAPEPGRYRLIASAEPVAGEAILQNNRQVAFVDVREGGGRVLVLEGAVRLETTDLRRALQQFPDLELTYRWIPRDTANRWPIDLGGDLAGGRYDIVVLGDLHAASLGAEQLELLKESVSAGMGLVTVGGVDAYGSGGYADSPLQDVLPVDLDSTSVREPGLPLSQNSDESAQVKGPITLQIQTPHPITSIELSDNDQEASWSILPPQPGANAWEGVKVAPGTQVLLVDSADHPMMVIGQYGRGRVASLAFDSTWIWWRQGYDEFHRRFWRQLMLWCLARDEDDEEPIRLELERRRWTTSQSTKFNAMWQPSENEDESLKLELIGPDGTEDLEATSIQTSDRQSTVTSSGALETSVAGFYQLKATLGERSAAIDFQVIDDTRELAMVATDHELLRQLSAASEETGGRSFRPEQVSELVEEIQSRRTRAERIVIEKSRLGDDPVSGWLVFGVFAIALCTEWALRRRWGVA